KGEVIVDRYADDTVMGFQYRADADRFLEQYGSGCGSSDWNSTQRRRAESSSGGTPSEIGKREGKVSPRRSTSWVSHTSVEPTGHKENSWCGASRLASGCG